jgi:hypothetical protein
MQFAAWFRKFFGGAGVSPADLSKLSATSEATLALSICKLQRGERGWISLPEAAHLFSNEETLYAFGEMDDEGKRRLGDFAAQCNSEIHYAPTETRVYFRRK